MDDDGNGRPLRVVQLSGRQLRTLAHPLRLRLLGMLRMGGPATATTLARLLTTNTGATSYHLRQLADVGLVAEDTGRNTGRQRFWRAEHEVSSFRPSDFDDEPDDRAAAAWIEGFQLQFLTEQTERWLGAQHEAPRQWRDAATLSDALLTLTPPQLRALNDEIMEVVTRYHRTATATDADDAAQVHVFLASFPRTDAAR